MFGIKLAFSLIKIQIPFILNIIFNIINLGGAIVLVLLTVSSPFLTFGYIFLFIIIILIISRLMQRKAIYKRGIVSKKQEMIPSSIAKNLPYPIDFAMPTYLTEGYKIQPFGFKEYEKVWLVGSGDDVILATKKTTINVKSYYNPICLAVGAHKQFAVQLFADSNDIITHKNYVQFDINPIYKFQYSKLKELPSVVDYKEFHSILTGKVMASQ